MRLDDRLAQKSWIAIACAFGWMMEEEKTATSNEIITRSSENTLAVGSSCCMYYALQIPTVDSH